MTGDEEPTPEDGRDVSRRDALKKIGVGAGIAWSTPVVLSFYNAAGAATGTPDNSTTTTADTIPPPLSVCAGATCESDTPCSSTADPDLGCVCVATSDPNASYCVPGVTLCTIGPPCAPDLTCRPGYFCAIDTCCHSNVCVPFTILASCPPDAEPTNGARVAPISPRVKAGAGTLGG